MIIEWIEQLRGHVASLYKEGRLTGQVSTLLFVKKYNAHRTRNLPPNGIDFKDQETRKRNTYCKSKIIISRNITPIRDMEHIVI